jgi:hypothetical protein
VAVRPAPPRQESQGPVGSRPVLGIVDSCAMMAPHGAPKSDRFGEEASTAATIPFLGAVICTSALCGPESASPGTG